MWTVCVLLSSGLDGRNRSLWKSLNIRATKNDKQVNSFYYNGHDIFVSSDICYLLQDLKSAILGQLLYLSAEFTEIEIFPTIV